MDKLFIGIDPGSKGFITTYDTSDGSIMHYSIEDNDLYRLSDIIGGLRDKYVNISCVMEETHAIFGSSAKATFSFGFNNGYLIGLLCANKIPYSLVPPKKWQKEMWDNKDLVITYKTVKRGGKDVSKKEVNTKQTSINACKRLFPTIDLRKNSRCKNIDDNKVDSILICEYARRMNL